MPTQGVYAEGVLGQCNTCETIDQSTFWDWKTSPCGDKAPDVVPPSKPLSSTTFKDLTADSIQDLVKFATLTDPTSTLTQELIKTLLAQAQTGNVDAKALLDKLIAGVLDALKTDPPKKDGGTEAPDTPSTLPGTTG